MDRSSQGRFKEFPTGKGVLYAIPQECLLEIVNRPSECECWRTLCITDLVKLNTGTGSL